MSTPRILVLTAAGKTGLPITLQLLNEGFAVTAFVRKEDHRSDYLRSKGATIVAGSVTDINDMRIAMTGVQRAYFNTPLEEGNLKAASVFTTVAAEQHLESVVVMSQWLAHPLHPSLHTREVWLAERLLALLPGTAVTTINVGFFADNDMQVLPFAAQFGLMMLPYGSGQNAPPSNDDIARVAAEILARPAGHAGKTYRPTGSTLLSPQDIAAVFSRVLERKVRYVDTPIWMMAKVMKGSGYSDYNIAQYEQYLLDYQQNAFAIGAPTDVVRMLTGKEPEAFETIVRRYVRSMKERKPNIGTQLRLMAKMQLWMLRPNPKTERYLSKGDFSDLQRVSLSAFSSEWLGSHEPKTTAAMVGN